MRIDNGHVSNSYLKGMRIHQTPLTQKISYGPHVCHLETDVSPFGIVGNSQFRF